MPELETGDEAIEGLSIIITVTEISGEFWSSVDLNMPDDDEEVDGTQFLVLLKGLELAHEKVSAVVAQLEMDVEMDDDDGDF